MANRIISIDCEANGLHGQIFAVGVSFQERGRGEVSSITARCPIVGQVDPWVAENVLPAIEGLPIDQADQGSLYRWWRTVYDLRKADGWEVLCHVAWPVESRFLWSAHVADPFSGPFPLLDVAGHLDHAGCDPASVDVYLTKRGIPLPDGSPHHPLYDARAAALAYWDLTDGRDGRG